jgi:hypothetical protein
VERELGNARLKRDWKVAAFLYRDELIIDAKGTVCFEKMIPLQVGGERFYYKPRKFFSCDFKSDSDPSFRHANKA